jgi:hypothetical protein
MAFGAKQEEMSSLPPPDYAERFMEFMETKVLSFSFACDFLISQQIFPSYLDDGKK